MLSNYKLKISIIFLLVFLFSCATIPKEAVKLNQEVGRSIESSHEAYLNLLNYYFEQRRNKIDNTMDRYTESLLSNLKEELPDSVKKIPIDKMGLLLKKVYKRRDILHEELEKTRMLLIDKINKKHMKVMNANSSISKILQSNVEVDKKLKETYTQSLNFIGLDLKLDDVTKILDNQLKEAGKVSGKIKDNYNKIENLYNEKED